MLRILDKFREREGDPPGAKVVERVGVIEAIGKTAYVGHLLGGGPPHQVSQEVVPIGIG